MHSSSSGSSQEKAGKRHTVGKISLLADWLTVVVLRTVWNPLPEQPKWLGSVTQIAG